MIIKTITLFSLLVSSTLSISIASTQPPPSVQHGFSTALVTRFMQKFHYKKSVLDDAHSTAILEHYIDSLDPNRNLFALEDIESFDRYKTTLDDALLRGNVGPAFTIFHLFNQRKIERAEYALERLEQPFDFTLDEAHQIDRSEAPWPKDRNELDDIWRKRVKNDLLNLTLANKSDDEIKKTLRKRYLRYKTRAMQTKAEDIFEIFINAYLKTIEPHTAYFSPRTSENFNINMSLSLEGIGAVLQTIGDDTVVRRVIPGGPADMSGQFTPGDRISGVAQGADGEIEDVVGWRLDDVVALIRGPKGSTVRLQTHTKASGPGGASNVITIIRDKIKLEEQHAKKSIIEIPNGDHSARIGVITIPTFYMDFAAAKRGDKDYVSTTRDTRQLLEELKKERVDGIVIDLARNGGGSLSEAISLSGLFIKSGPVVQVRNGEGELELHEDSDKNIAYSGPLAVLVNRYSASASEIFAGAMQDYGRAIIIGEPTFGKGTVQQIFDLNDYISRSDTTLGQVKLTVAQFFRINGDSTQNRGVIPDIIFPTAGDSNEQGESSLENALPWVHIEAANFSPYPRAKNRLKDIAANHQKRVQTDSGFEFLIAQAEARKTALEKTSLTLLKTKRKTEREKQKSESLGHLNSFRSSVGLAPKKINDLQEEESYDNEDNDKFVEEIRLIQVKETAAILVDLIHQAQIGKKVTQQSKTLHPGQL